MNGSEILPPSTVQSIKNLGCLQLKSNAVPHPTLDGHEKDIESILITFASCFDNVLRTEFPYFPYFEM